jgi:hypothetical protein
MNGRGMMARKLERYYVKRGIIDWNIVDRISGEVKHFECSRSIARSTAYLMNQCENALLAEIGQKTLDMDAEKEGKS